MNMNLKIGSTGEDVKKLQQKLGLNVDGVFGSSTEVAVKKWQQDNGLTSDGIVGPKTWSKMMGEVVEKNLDINVLKGHIPDNVFNQLDLIVQKFSINTPLRMAHFLSQCSHESGDFSVVNENLNYSSDGLKRVFGKYFPGTLSESYARQPQKIANRVYSNRMGNGDENSGDGYRFRGRGYIQLTGKENYKKFSDFIGEDCVSNSDLVATKYSLASAAFFFVSNKLNQIADTGSSNEVVTLITKRINGGTNGLSDRLGKFKKFYGILS